MILGYTMYSSVLGYTMYCSLLGYNSQNSVPKIIKYFIHGLSDITKHSSSKPNTGLRILNIDLFVHITETKQ